MPETPHKTRTLGLLTVLHFFTHLYHVALLPLFLEIQKDFDLSSTDEATLLLTVLMLAYYAPSFLAGTFADRLNRRKLLAVGLAINGLGFAGLACAHTYPLAIASVIVAGLGGSLYHPSGMALVADLFQGKGGRAFGIVGIGGGLGFFLGPLYTGWRAEMTGDWRTPVVELGLAGVAAAVAFFLLADSLPMKTSKNTKGQPRQPIFPSRLIWVVFAVAILSFGLRDFGGNGVSTLGSLFLQKAHGWNLARTGFALSLIFLAAIISNPLFGYLSDRAGNRTRWIAFTLTIGAATAIFIPRLTISWTIPMFIVHGFFFMACYPMIEALMMEAVPPAVRGRVVGFYLTVSGGAGTIAHWMCGYWVDNMGNRASQTAAYQGYYVLLGGVMLVTLLGVGCLDWIRRKRMAEQTETAPTHG
ncbi:MAG: hypothetical protein CMJ62_21415 [Planctomycetaceae bacterium]|jgi:MFS family permease|nr:hypothetical protein [Planctomycetaceae bacterium]